VGEGARPTLDAAEAVVIGGGVVGCAVLLELAIRGIDAVLLEAESDVAEGTSKANSAIIHTGFDAKRGTIEARLLRRSAERWPTLLEDLGVPALACGALMLARSEDDAARLGDAAELARTHGVSVELVDSAWLRDAAPYVTEAAVRALHIPDEAIVDPFWLTRAYADAAIGLGARVVMRSAVSGLTVRPDGVEVRTGEGTIRAGHAFDCAGLRADDVARLAGDDTFTITPRKGEFLVSERTAGVDRIVLPIPGPLGKGMLVTPIVFGGVLLGPTAEDGSDKTDRSTTAAGRARILDSCRGLVPAVDEMAPIRSFAGLRPVSSTGDYIIRPSAAGDRLTIVAGIRSTGISASPGIAEAAVEVAASARGWASRPLRTRPTAAPQELAPHSGAIVCVCRSVSEAEVAAALAGATPVTTIDALKRRCGVGFGDCQGNQCAIDAVARLADANGMAPGAIEKGLIGSWLVTDATSGAPRVRSVETVERPPGESRDADAVVVGAGMAGIGAALALAAAGLAVVLVDRRERPGGAIGRLDPSWWTDAERAALDEVAALISDASIGWIGATTVVALDRVRDRWRVELASRRGAASIETNVVIVATGGYVMPREHSVIEGPRPSGVMTADLVGDALDHGWAPARQAVVVGSGRLAAATADGLRAAGAEVIRPAHGADGADDAGGGADDPRPDWSGAVAAGVRGGITAVRGQPRLEGVRVDGAWLDADALVLADRLQPATFLLRGLGLGDERPGIPAPVRPNGGLGLPGLWAAGTCVTPDVDHERSLVAGHTVAQAILATRSPAQRRAGVTRLSGRT
jgi:glycerol-3-phosphate dehydrogenase